MVRQALLRSTLGLWLIALSLPGLAAELRHGSAIATADRADILELMALYPNYWETHRCADWAALFTEDGVFQSLQGRAALVEGCEKAAQAGTDQIHLVGNVVLIQLDANHVKAVSQVLFGRHQPKVENSAQFTGYGDYLDEFERTRAGWRFKKRVAGAHVASPLPAEFHGLAGR